LYFELTGLFVFCKSSADQARARFSFPAPEISRQVHDVLQQLLLLSHLGQIIDFPFLHDLCSRSFKADFLFPLYDLAYHVIHVARQVGPV